MPGLTVKDIDGLSTYPGSAGGGLPCRIQRRRGYRRFTMPCVSSSTGSIQRNRDGWSTGFGHQGLPGRGGWACQSRTVFSQRVGGECPGGSKGRAAVMPGGGGQFELSARAASWSGTFPSRFAVGGRSGSRCIAQPSLSPVRNETRAPGCRSRSNARKPMRPSTRMRSTPIPMTMDDYLNGPDDLLPLLGCSTAMFLVTAQRPSSCRAVDRVPAICATRSGAGRGSWYRSARPARPGTSSKIFPRWPTGTRVRICGLARISEALGRRFCGALRRLQLSDVVVAGGA